MTMPIHQIAQRAFQVAMSGPPFSKKPSFEHGFLFKIEDSWTSILAMADWIAKNDPTAEVMFAPETFPVRADQHVEMAVVFDTSEKAALFRLMFSHGYEEDAA